MFHDLAITSAFRSPERQRRHGVARWMTHAALPLLVVLFSQACSAAYASFEVTDLSASGSVFGSPDESAFVRESFEFDLDDLVDGAVSESVSQSGTNSAGRGSSGGSGASFKIVDDGFEYGLGTSASNAQGDGGFYSEGSLRGTFTTDQPYHVVVSGEYWADFVKWERRFMWQKGQERPQGRVDTEVFVEWREKDRTYYDEPYGYRFSMDEDTTELYGETYEGRLAVLFGWYDDFPGTPEKLTDTPYLPAGTYFFGGGFDSYTSRPGEGLGKRFSFDLTFVPVSVVPEPSAALLAFAAMTAACGGRRRRSIRRCHR